MDLFPGEMVTAAVGVGSNFLNDRLFLISRRGSELSFSSESENSEPPELGANVFPLPRLRLGHSSSSFGGVVAGRDVVSVKGGRRLSVEGEVAIYQVIG